MRLNLNCNYEFEVSAFNCKLLLADENENRMLMSINCWILDNVCSFFK